MDNATPKLISVDEYNSSVRIWSTSTRRKMARNAPVASGKLLRSLTHKLKKIYGETSKITYSFERHGVFVHYGVGRGYIRVGNDVIPGRNLTGREKDSLLKRGDSKKDINKLKISYNNGEVKRTPNDWFDVEIRLGIGRLAEIAQSYYGDKAMQKILSRIDKITISKKL